MMQQSQEMETLKESDDETPVKKTLNRNMSADDAFKSLADKR